MSDDLKAYFAPPSLEGASLALKELLVEGRPNLLESKQCAVAIDVFNPEGILIQRALAHAAVSMPVRDAFRELVDRAITSFADAQDLDAARATEGGPYRGGFIDSNEFSGFDCGYALAIARGRVAKLRSSLKSADALVVRLFAIPFLVVDITRESSREVVILRKDDGTYVFELVELPDHEKE